MSIQSKNIDRMVVEWLCGREVGISSKALMRVLVYKVPLESSDYPHDPSDFERCRRMVEFLGLENELRAFIESCPQEETEWHRILRNWDLIKSEIDEEKDSGKCPKAYKTMRNLIDGVRK